MTIYLNSIVIPPGCPRKSLLLVGQSCAVYIIVCFSKKDDILFHIWRYCDINWRSLKISVFALFSAVTVINLMCCDVVCASVRECGSAGNYAQEGSKGIVESLELIEDLRKKELNQAERIT